MLGYKFTQSGVAPLGTKTSAILNSTAPKNLKQLRSILESVHHHGKFIRNLQQVIDYTLVGLDNTHCFLDDIIVVSRGSKEDHLKLVYKCLKR